MELTNAVASIATNDDQGLTESEREKENAACDDGELSKDLQQMQILALSSEEDSEDDIFSNNTVDTSKLPRVSIVDESTTESDNEILEETPKKSSPKQKKASIKSVSTSSTRLERLLLVVSNRS